MRFKLIQKLTFLFVLLVVLIPVYFGLGRENVNVDQFLWYQRTDSFKQALATRNYSQTYQQYHPGVTLMYLIIAGQKIYALLQHDTSSFKNINFEKFAIYNFWTKFFVTTTCVLLNLLSAFFLYKITKSRAVGLGFLLILFTEPFYVGLVRNLHMDALVGSLIFVSIVTFYEGLRSRQLWITLLSGILAGFAILTKSIAVTGIAVNFTVLVYFLFREKNKLLLKYFGLFLIATCCVFFTFFPAMWVAPFQTLQKIYINGIVKTGIEGDDSFTHVVRGVISDSPGNDFYFQIFKFRLNPLTQFALISAFPLLCFIFFTKSVKYWKNYQDTQTNQANEANQDNLANKRSKTTIISLLNQNSLVHNLNELNKSNKLNRLNQLNKRILPQKLSREKLDLLVLSVVYILVYFIIFSLLQKKTDRYIAPMLPFISLVAVLVFDYIFVQIKLKKIQLGFIIVLSIGFLFNLFIIFKIHPYYMAYYSPVWGGINRAKKHLYINQGGIGAYEVANFLNSKNLVSSDLIGATNFEELRVFSKYPIQGLAPSKRKDYKYVVLTLQKDDDFKHGMSQVYSVNVLGETFLRVFGR